MLTRARVAFRDGFTRSREHDHDNRGTLHPAGRLSQRRRGGSVSCDWPARQVRPARSPPNDSSVCAERSTTRGAMSTSTQVKTRRRWLTVAALLAAAASLVVAFAIRRPIRTPTPVLVAHIDHATRSAGPGVSFGAGGAVMSGSTVTTAAGTLAMTLTSGVQLRLDASSTAAWTQPPTSRSSVGPCMWTRPAPIPPSRARLRSASTRRRDSCVTSARSSRFGWPAPAFASGCVTARCVSPARTAWTLEGTRARNCSRGLTGSDRSISRRPIAANGSEWAWAERAAPPFSVEGKTLGAFLDWVSREGAWTVTFADRRISERARATVLHGRPDLLDGLTPDEALDVVLPTCGLRHRIDGHQVVIERETGAGATR